MGSAVKPILVPEGIDLDRYLVELRRRDGLVRKKTKKGSAFYAYLLQRQRDLRNSGDQVADAFEDLKEFVGREWATMSAADKNAFRPHPANMEPEDEAETRDALPKTPRPAETEGPPEDEPVGTTSEGPSAPTTGTTSALVRSPSVPAAALASTDITPNTSSSVDPTTSTESESPVRRPRLPLRRPHADFVRSLVFRRRAHGDQEDSLTSSPKGSFFALSTPECSPIKSQSRGDALTTDPRLKKVFHLLQEAVDHLKCLMNL